MLASPGPHHPRWQPLSSEDTRNKTQCESLTTSGRQALKPPTRTGQTCETGYPSASVHP